MNRKLWLLNLLLLAAAVGLGNQLKQNWLEARRREAMLLSSIPPAASVQPYQKAAAPAPVTPASYIDVAQKLLFSRSRNPNVEVPVPPPPPPPPVMPPLPKAYGFMNWGGPKIILSEKAGSAQKIYRPGDSIGEFKLVAVDKSEIVFEWNGGEVRRKLEELRDTQPTIAAAPPPAQAAAAPANSQAASTLGANASNTPAAATDLNAQSTSGPDKNAGGIPHSVAPGDTHPVGAVVDGYRKTERMTPFGKAQFWDPVK